MSITLNKWKIYIGQSSSDIYVGGLVESHPIRSGNVLFLPTSLDDRIVSSKEETYKLFDFCPNQNASSEEEAFQLIMNQINKQ